MTETPKPHRDFHGDDDAEQAFMDTHDLTEFDFAPNAVPAKAWFSRYAQYKRDARIHLRRPSGSIEAVKP